MACGSCGGSHAPRSAITTADINAARAAQTFVVDLPDGTSHTHTTYLAAIREKKRTPGATMRSA